LGVKKYTENFDYKISKLINEYPENHLNKNGAKFWSGSKRFLHSIRYDVVNDLCFLCIKSFSLILSRILGIQEINDDEYIKNISKKIEIPNYVQTNENNNKNNDNKSNNIVDNTNTIDDIELLMESLIQGKEDKEINLIKEELNKININSTKINSVKFEKDDDNNGHIDFIYSSSNIRARNYNIKEMEKQKIKMIAGRIVSAMATTLATITGIVCLQLYTLNQTNKINYFRNYLNLAINRFIMTLSSPQIKHVDKECDEELDSPLKAIPSNWTVWDKIIIKGSQTPKELINYIKIHYNVDVIIITSNNITISQNFLSFKNENNNMKIEEIYFKEANKINIKINKNYLILKINGEFNKIPVIMPIFKYIFKE